MTQTFRSALVTAFAVAAAIVTGSGAFAQQARVPAGSPVLHAQPLQQEPVPGTPVVDFDAERTREEFSQLLDRYPPTLGRVLKLDPSLMTSESYLAPYPALAVFLSQHPEVARNSAFFLERVSLVTERGWVLDQQTMWRRDMAGILAGVAAFFAFLVVTSVIVWLVRTIIEHRRWNKVSKTQFDVHSKLLERFTTNEELLAYIQTPVGRRFLESGPTPLPGEPRPVGAPFSRILWSVQAGVVLTMAGVGLLFLSWRLTADSSLVFMGFGVIALALGGGFVASGAAAYGLSRRFGLLERSDVDHA